MGWNPQVTAEASETMDSPGADNKEPLQLLCPEVSLTPCAPCLLLGHPPPRQKSHRTGAVVFTKKRKIQDTGCSGSNMKQLDSKEQAQV